MSELEQELSQIKKSCEEVLQSRLFMSRSREASFDGETDLAKSIGISKEKLTDFLSTGEFSDKSTLAKLREFKKKQDALLDARLPL